MIERNIGDIITHDSTSHHGIRLWKIIDIRRHSLSVRIVKHECPSMIGRRVSKMNTYAYILYQAANPNLTTVLASNYMDDDSLTEEDKEIIKEYLYDKAA